jgi:hypothetical protein
VPSHDRSLPNRATRRNNRGAWCDSVDRYDATEDHRVLVLLRHPTFPRRAPGACDDHRSWSGREHGVNEDPLVGTGSPGQRPADFWTPPRQAREIPTGIPGRSRFSRIPIDHRCATQRVLGSPDTERRCLGVCKIPRHRGRRNHRRLKQGTDASRATPVEAGMATMPAGITHMAGHTSTGLTLVSASRRRDVRIHLNPRRQRGSGSSTSKPRSGVPDITPLGRLALFCLGHRGP